MKKTPIKRQSSLPSFAGQRTSLLAMLFQQLFSLLATGILAFLFFLFLSSSNPDLFQFSSIPTRLIDSSQRLFSPQILGEETSSSIQVLGEQTNPPSPSLMLKEREEISLKELLFSLNNQISSLQLTSNSVSSQKIQRHTIEQENIDSNSITSRTIRDKTIQSEDLSSHLSLNQISLDQLTVGQGRPSHFNLSSGDVFVQNKLEIDGNAYFDSTLYVRDSSSISVMTSSTLRTTTANISNILSNSNLHVRGRLPDEDTFHLHDFTELFFYPSGATIIGRSTLPSFSHIDGANDLYVQDDLEVDGTIYGTLSGSLTNSNISQWTNDQNYLLTETDPLFSAWNKSAGITITESQITDLQAYFTNLASFTTDNLTEGSTNKYTQWTTNGTDLYYQNNVGIGTTSPNSKLEINGDLRLSTGSGAQIIFADGSTMSSSGLGSAAALSNTTDAIVTGDSDSNSSGDIILKTGSNDRLHILNNGNVGIGTTNPTEKLQLGSSFKINSSGIITGAGGNISMWTNDSSYLTSYTETDPNVSAWARNATKPTYTASEVGLGNVTNESKATMFSSPTFTGTISGITSTMVGLGNVPNLTFSGSNTGDNAVNTLYSSLVTNATHSGDATGATALTLATVNSNVGSFGSSTAIPTFTVNAKGLITAASTAVVVAPAGTLTGTTLASGVTGSSLTSVGTLGSLAVTGAITWSGGGSANANTAYSERLQWDGGSTNLVAATGRTSLGLVAGGGGDIWVEKGGDTMTGVLTINSTSDNQIMLTSSDTWAGIGFDDSGATNDYIWYNGANATFAIGGGGSNISGKKLHVDGGMTIGVNYDATAMAANGLSVEGNVATAGTVTWSGGGSANANTAYTHSQDVTGGVHGAVSTNTANMLVRRDGSGNFSAGIITGATDIRAPIFYDTDSTAYYFSSLMRVDTISSGVLSDTLELGYENTGGNIAFYRPQTMQAGMYIYPGSSSGTNQQTSYYLYSNSSYGLQTNTSFRAEGLYDGANRVYSAGNPQVNISGNAVTLTNFTSNPTRSDGGDYSLVGRTTGLYAIAGAGTNGPGPTYLSLIHAANGTDVAFQIAGGYTSDAMFFRGTSALQNGTGYTPWRTVIHSGNISSQTVATATNNVLKSGDTMSGNLTFNNYGLGMYGTYSSTVYQNVFSMGAAYGPAADGSSLSNMYGIAWTHTNVGGQSKPGLGHQALFVAAGATQTAIGAGIWTSGTVTAPIYTGSVSGSSYGSIKVSGTTGSYAGTYYSDAAGSVGGMFDTAGNGGDYDPTTSWHYYWNRANASLGIGGSTTVSGYKAYVNGNLGVQNGSQLYVRYTTSEAYKASLSWYGLQLGNNGGNYIVAGRTSAGGSLNFVVNNTSDFPTVNGTTAMTIDSAGNVGIGTASPTAKLAVAAAASGGLYVGNGTFNNPEGWNQVIDLQGASHARIEARTATVNMGMYAHDSWTLSGAAGYIGTYTNHPIGFQINAVTKMTLDTNGNVGIGTAGPLTKLHISSSGTGIINALTLTNPSGAVAGNGTAIAFGSVADNTNAFGQIAVVNRDTGNGSHSYMTFSTRLSDVLAEKMRINESGKVGIGTTAPLATLSVGPYEGPVGAAISGYKTGTGTYGIYGQAEIGVYGTSNATNGIGIYGAAGIGSTKGVMASGTAYDFFANGAGVDYGTSSSIRWKSNIKNITGALDAVMNLRAITYDMNQEHGGGHQIGFIGEEIGKYFPEIVSFDQDSSDPSYYVTGMDYSKMTPVLLSAIQEQQAEISNYKLQITNEFSDVQSQITNDWIPAFAGMTAGLATLTEELNKKANQADLSELTITTQTNYTDLLGNLTDHEQRIQSLEEQMAEMVGGTTSSQPTLSAGMQELDSRLVGDDTSGEYLFDLDGNLKVKKLKSKMIELEENETPPGCEPEVEGSFYYDFQKKTFLGCDGTVWQEMQFAPPAVE